MKPRCVHVAWASLLGPALILALAAGTARANVYVSGVTVDATGLDGLCGALKVSYILNENANGDGTRPGILIEVLDGSAPPVAVRTVAVATQVKGPHAWEWDGRKDDGSPAPNGTYSIRITAADIGHTTWTKISAADAAHSFAQPRSVGVNKRQASPHYGKIYVTEATGGSPGGRRTTQDGIYCLYADGREATFSNAVDTRAGQTGYLVNWTSDGSNNSAPYKLNIGPDDDHVYVTTVTDGANFVFDFEPDLSGNPFQLIKPNNLVSDQWVYSAYVTGSKDGLGGRLLYVVNDNYNDGDTQGVLRFTLGSATRVANAVKADMQYVGPSLAVYLRDIDRDPVAPDIEQPTYGDFYLNTYRANVNNEPTVFKVSGSATQTITTPIWASPKDGTYILGVGFGRDEFAQAGWPKNIIACAQAGTGQVRFYNANTKDFLDTFQAEGTSADVQDAAFDDAGNLYTVCNGSKYLKIWSPPDGPNHKTFTTGAFTLNKTAVAGPTIVNSPVDASLCANGSVSFTVSATGTGILTYQWMKDGVALADCTPDPNAVPPVTCPDGVTVAGATTDTLSLSNVPTAYGETQFTVLVCDDTGMVISAPATLHVGVFFAQQPAAQTVCHDTDATFTVLATGVGDLSYQWQENSSGSYLDIPDATSSSLTVAGVAPAMSGTNYRVVVTDSCGSRNSSAAKLTVLGNPEISHVGYGGTIPQDGQITLICNATGTGLLHYQWKHDGVNVGTDSNKFTIKNATCQDAGLYSCTVTDDCGSTTRDTDVLGNPTRVIVSSTDICGNGIDEDCDGVVDNGAPEVCNDGIDNDCDNRIDCMDPDCGGVAGCCNVPWADAQGPAGIGSGLGDQDVDQEDFAVFQLCFTGAAGPIPADPAYCTCLDQTGPTPGTPDGLIDMNDLLSFEACATGPTILWASTTACP